MNADIIIAPEMHLSSMKQAKEFIDFINNVGQVIRKVETKENTNTNKL